MISWQHRSCFTGEPRRGICVYPSWIKFIMNWMPGHVPRTTFGDENRGTEGGLSARTPESIHEGVGTLDGIDDLTHAEGLPQGAVEALMAELGDLSVREL